MRTHMIQDFPLSIHMRRFPFQALVSFLLIVAGFGIHDASGEASTSAEKTAIGVGMPAASFLAREIGQDKVEVITALPEGYNHEFSSITPQTMARLLDADIFLTMGLPFENQIVEALRQRKPQMIIVRLDEGIERIRMEEDHHHSHPGHEHSAACETETGEDPHIWMDPLNMIRMAQKTGMILKDKMPLESDGLNQNLAMLVTRLQALHNNNMTKLHPMKGSLILTYHPAFGYYAEAYGLNQVAVESEGKSPSARKISDLLGNSREGLIRCMLIQPQFNTPPIRRLATRISLPVEVVDPLSTDYIGMIEHLTDVLLSYHSKVSGS